MSNAKFILQYITLYSWLIYFVAAIKNSEFFEVLVPYDYFNFGLKESIKVEDGLAHLPSKPGLGIDLDWDFIDNSTFKKY